MRVATPLIGLGLAVSMALAGCSQADEPDSPEPRSQETPTATETPYLDVPDGVELSDQGSELEVGDDATVAYEPRQGMVGALDITVTSLERATFKMFEGFELKKSTLKTAPYFVRATVTNVGGSNLGGRPVPLYIVDGENRLIESSVFAGSFKPCSGSTFPKKFRTGDRMKACLVYLAPGKGKLTAVSFRPSQEFDPITWTGDLVKAGSRNGKGDSTGNARSKPGKKGRKGGGDRG